MKRLSISMCAVLFFICATTALHAQKGTMGNMPYKATYSSDFSMGNTANAKMVLELWKDWDDNAFDRHDYMADTVVMFLSGGNVVHGKDSAMAGAKAFRGSLKSAVSTISAVIPLKSNDRHENWVAVWGSETDTYADGKVETRDLQEIWRINKDGKIDFMKQFAATPGAMDK